MLSLHLQARPSFRPLTLSPFKPHYQRPRARARSSMIRVSSTSQGTVVEHVVLVKVKDDTEPTKVNAMVNAMNSLATLEGVKHLTVGPLLRNGPNGLTTTSSGLRFTHMLHSRYSSKEALGVYNKHPSHVNAVRGFLFPVCDDLMVVDWIAGGANLPPLAKGSGLRVSFLKLKESTYEEVKDEALSVIRGMEHAVGGVLRQFSCGENFSPERAKGFALALLAVFPGREELESVGLDEGLGMFVEHVEDVVVVDYVVP